MYNILTDKTIQTNINDAILLGQINKDMDVLQLLCSEYTKLHTQLVIIQQFDSLVSNVGFNTKPELIQLQYDICCESMKSKILTIVNKWKSIRVKFLNNMETIAKQLKNIKDTAANFNYKIIDDPKEALKANFERYSRVEFDNVISNIKNCTEFKINEEKTTGLKQVSFNVSDTSIVDLVVKKKINEDFNKSNVVLFSKDYLAIYDQIVSIVNKLQQILDFIEKDSITKVITDTETKDQVTKTTTTTTIDYSKREIYRKVGERITHIWKALHKLEDIFKSNTRRVLSMHYKQKEIKQ